jgi:tyrosinase
MSLSGNGQFILGRNGTLQPLPVPLEDPPALYSHPGEGGGYNFEGPLVDWRLHLGPVTLASVQNTQVFNPNPRPDSLGYNPRRMIQCFNNNLLQASNT